MFQTLDHPFDRGRALELAHAADFAEAEALDGLAHALSGADRAADELDANFIGHRVSPISKIRSSRRFRLIRRAAAEPVDILRTAQLGQSFEGRLDEIVGIRRAEAFGQDVANTGQLDHGAHTARRDDAGAFGGRAQHDASRAETSDDFVRNGAVLNRHADQAFLGAIDALANRLGHFVGFAEAESDQAVMIARNHQRAEAEAASALHDLGDAVDVHDLLFDLEALRIDALHHRAFS